jgi:predicted PurR-regulated permease PerM
MGWRSATSRSERRTFEDEIMGDLTSSRERRRETALLDNRCVPLARSRYGLLASGVALIATCVVLFLVWQTISSLLLIFAGVLLAAFLDAAARMLAPVVPLRRVWRLTVVLMTLGILIGLCVVWGAGKVPEQTRLLINVMDTQFHVLQQYLLAYGLDLLGPEWGRDFAQWLLADQTRLLGHAHFLLGSASSFLAGAVVVAFLGVLFAFNPVLYRESIVLLVTPSYRARTRAVMDEMGHVLRLWLVSQLIRMVVMTLCMWPALYLVGLPGPFVLGLQAGVSSFIPYLGPMAAAVPVALVAMPLGMSPLVWAVVIYTVIQSIEGHVIGPLIQRQAIETPPAWTLAAIVVSGALFGILGIALAMPLVAIGRVMVTRLYVEDYLGDGERQEQSSVSVS